MVGRNWVLWEVGTGYEGRMEQGLRVGWDRV